MYKKILIRIPGDKVEVLAALEAMRETVKYFPHPVVMDVIVNDEECAQLVTESCLASNISIYQPEEPVDLVELANKYDLVHVVEPTPERGYSYGESDRDKKLEDMKKFLGKTPDGELPVTPYSLFSTVVMDFAKALQTLEENYEITEYISMIDVRPYAIARGKARNSVKKKLRTSITAGDGKPVRDDYYIVYAIPEGASEKYRDAMWDLGDEVDVPAVYVESDGRVWGSEEVLTLTEQVALIENPNCLMVMSQDWRAYLGWAFMKPFTFQLMNREDVGAWSGIRSTRSVVWSLDKHPIPTIKQHFKNLVSFNLKEFILSDTEVSVHVA